MDERNNPMVAVGFVKVSPDRFGDLSADMVTDPQVKHPLTCDQSHGDPFANDTYLFNVINPNRSTVLHMYAPQLCACEHGGPTLAGELTNGVKIMGLSDTPRKGEAA